MAALEIPAMPLKHEAQHYDQHHESEFVEVEEEPYSEPQEEWEKDIPPFLRKLSTMPDGSLVVKNPDFLNTHLLPTYFQSIKACSFVRQLNMYGFHKVDDPTGQNPKHFEFKHPNFVPGRKELLRRIERRKTSKRSTKTEDEPSAKNNKNTTPISATSSPSPVASPATNIIFLHILEAVTKLQQQTQDNQQALMQVLGELKSYRQSHEELERKLNQYVSQQGSVRAVSPPRLIENEPQALLLVNHQQQQQQPRQQHRPIATVNRNRLQQQQQPLQQQPLQQHPQQHHQQHPQHIHHQQQQQHNGNMNAGVNRINPNTMNAPNGMNGVPLNNNNRNMNGNVVRNVQNVVPQNNHVNNYQPSANPNYYPTGIEVYSSVPLAQPYTPVYTNVDDGSSYLASNNNLISQNYISDLHQSNNIIYSPTSNEPSPISVTASPQYSSLSDSSPSDPSSSPYQDYQSPNDPNSSLSHSSSSQFNYDNNQTFTTSNTAGGEQIDEFVLLNLGLEDSSAQFHDYLDNNQFSSSSSSSFDPTLTAN